jgi:hypothetical protein
MTTNGHEARARYLTLRDGAFSRTAQETGAAPSAATPHVFGVIVEYVLGPESRLTLASFVDGVTSLYIEQGPAIVGGGGIAAVAAASRKLVSETEKYFAHMKPTTTRPDPTKGVVRFFALTFEGVFSAETVMTHTANGGIVWTGPFRDLLPVADHVITQLRLNSSDVITQQRLNSSATGQGAYNIVSDTVTGLNIRKSDNLFQLKVILVCVLLGVPLGAIAGAVLSDANYRWAGALGGGCGLAFAGVVLGLFGSGLYLMIYRAIRHLQGKHD